MRTEPTQRLHIGISACFMHSDPARAAFAKKTLLYLEQSMAHWVMAAGALPVLVPAPPGEEGRAEAGLNDYADWLDGLILHGGADLWPGHYGELPMRPEWRGDALRDAYEMALVRAFTEAGKPVLGVCRGLQLINVAYGGSLYQDLAEQGAAGRAHRDGEVYDQLFHEVDLVPGTRLDALLGAQASRKINSIHHQGIKTLAPGFMVEARCPDDGVIEAIRHTGGDWVAAVQWHPEFHRAADGVIDDTPLLLDFLAAARATRGTVQEACP